MGLEPTTAWTTTRSRPFYVLSMADVCWVRVLSGALSFAQIGTRIGTRATQLRQAPPAGVSPPFSPLQQSRPVSEHCWFRNPRR
jgi:hypothetical protein